MLHLTPANLFEGSRLLCLILPTHRPLIYCPNHGKPPLTEQPRSPSLHLIASASLWLLLQLLLQIADIFAVTFASRQFVLFDFASTRTSSLLLSQVCEMYRTCFCASLWLASQSHLRCAAVLCSCSSCGSWASVWGILFGQHYLMQPLKVVVALNGRDWGDSHGFVQCHVSADATIHQN